MTIAESKAARKHDLQSFEGRTDFPDSTYSPPDVGNVVPLYAVIWMRNGKPTGNSWTSREKAERVVELKQVDGTFHSTHTSYCSGFAF